jgi:hypothetical protein
MDKIYMLASLGTEFRSPNRLSGTIRLHVVQSSTTFILLDMFGTKTS